MNRFLLAALLAAPAAAAPLPAQPDVVAQNQRYVNGAVRGTINGHWDVQDYQGRIWLNVSTFGNSISFNGRPISGSLFGSGNYYSISAGGVSGNISRFGSSVDVRATVFGQGGTRWLNFTMYVNGPVNDPNRMPSLSIFSGDASLNFNPSFNREYSVSGRVDDQRFGDEGLALAYLASTLIMKEHETLRAAAIPKSDFLQKSAVVAPFLKAGFGR